MYTMVDKIKKMCYSFAVDIKKGMGRLCYAISVDTKGRNRAGNAKKCLVRLCYATCGTQKGVIEQKMRRRPGHVRDDAAL